MTPPGKKYFSKIIIALSFHFKIQSALQLYFLLVPINKICINLAKRRITTDIFKDYGKVN
jgi:hypothetical protein